MEQLDSSLAGDSESTAEFPQGGPGPPKKGLPGCLSILADSLRLQSLGGSMRKGMDYDAGTQGAAQHRHARRKSKVSGDPKIDAGCSLQVRLSRLLQERA